MRLNVEICWIFIFHNSDNNTLKVDYCSDDLLDDFLELHTGRMIYYRRFDNLMDAIALKKYLSELSDPKLRLVIEQMNPRNCNLRPIIKQMILN